MLPPSRNSVLSRNLHKVATGKDLHIVTLYLESGLFQKVNESNDELTLIDVIHVDWTSNYQWHRLQQSKSKEKTWDRTGTSRIIFCSSKNTWPLHITYFKGYNFKCDILHSPICCYLHGSVFMYISISHYSAFSIGILISSLISSFVTYM